MRVLIVSQYYPPENVLIPFDVAQGLRERGHDVRVLTGYPNYPAGQIFPGYRQRWRHRSIEQGIDVLRVPLFIDHSQNAMKRMMNYFTFACSSALAWRFSRGVDVIYVYATQMTPALGPWLWRKAGGAPYVLHVQDLWPDSIIGSALSGGGKKAQLIEAFLTPWLKRVYMRASGVIAIAPRMLDTLVDRGVLREKARLVYNWAGEVPSPKQPEFQADGPVRIVYAGNLGEMQDLENVVRAAAEVEPSQMQLTLVGDGVMKPLLEALVSDLGVNHVHFKEPVPKEQMAEIYSSADFGLVSLRALPVFEGTVPSKFQTILAHGLPVVTTVQGDVRSITDEYGLGITADAESVHDLVRAFRAAASCTPEARQRMGDQARKAAKEMFARDGAIDKIEASLADASYGGKVRK